MDKRNNRNPETPLVFNHFENIRGLVTKTGLIRSLKLFYKHNQECISKEYSVFMTTPSTFLLSAALDDQEFQEFSQRFRELQKGFCLKEKLPQKHCEKNIWLVKPAAANQGKGIEIF